MDLTAAQIVGVLDRVGFVAAAFAGVEVGARRRLDVFGLFVMGVVSATGGGVLRDIALVRVPLVLERWDYIAWAVGGAAAAIVLLWARRSMPAAVLAVAGAAGLGAFAVAGAFAGMHAGLPVTAVVLLGILTATGGGVLRDLLADRIPAVLRTEVNAMAAALGALTAWGVAPVSNGLAALLGVGVAALVRVAGLAFDLHLPVLRMQPASRNAGTRRPADSDAGTVRRHPRLRAGPGDGALRRRDR